MRWYLLRIFVIYALVAGCMPTQPLAILDASAPCDEILRPTLLTLPFEELVHDRATAEQWILTEYPTTTVEFQPSNGQGGIGYFIWFADSKGFILALTELARYVEQNTHKYPTLGQILGCYGEPQYYSLGEINRGVEVTSAVGLELWYPTRGLYFESVTSGTSTIGRYDSNSPIVGTIRVMPSGTVEEMIQYGRLNREYYQNPDLTRLKEWPDNFTEIVPEE